MQSSLKQLISDGLLLITTYYSTWGNQLIKSTIDDNRYQSIPIDIN